MKALETTATIEKSGLLRLDDPLSISAKKKVKVIILYAEDEEMEDKSWLSSVSDDPAFAFLHNKKEDIYSLADGKPFKP